MSNYSNEHKDNEVIETELITKQSELMDLYEKEEHIDKDIEVLTPESFFTNVLIPKVKELFIEPINAAINRIVEVGDNLTSKSEEFTKNTKEIKSDIVKVDNVVNNIVTQNNKINENTVNTYNLVIDVEESINKKIDENIKTLSTLINENNTKFDEKISNLKTEIIEEIVEKINENSEYNVSKNSENNSNLTDIVERKDKKQTLLFVITIVVVVAMKFI